MFKNVLMQDYVNAYHTRKKRPRFFVFTAATSINVGNGPETMWTSFRKGWGDVGFDPIAVSDNGAPRECPNADEFLEWWKFPGWFFGELKTLMHQQNPERYFDPKNEIPVLFHFKPVHGILHFAQGARFAASRKAIQSRPKAYYQEILKLLDQSRKPWVVYYLEWVWWYVLGGNEGPCGTEKELDQLVKKHNVCNADENVNFPGHDITEIPGLSQEHCCKRCVETKKCAVWTWRNTDMTCWLKAEPGIKVIETGVYSGVLNRGAAT